MLGDRPFQPLQLPGVFTASGVSRVNTTYVGIASSLSYSGFTGMVKPQLGCLRSVIRSHGFKLRMLTSFGAGSVGARPHPQVHRRCQARLAAVRRIGVQEPPQMRGAAAPLGPHFPGSMAQMSTTSLPPSP